MRSLVLDQSTTAIGFAVVDDTTEFELFPGLKGRLLQHGRITTRKSSDISERLRTIKKDLIELIIAYKPGEIIIEETRFYRQKSGDTALAMSAIYLLCKELSDSYGMVFYTQYPQTIKKNVTGNGKADKEEVKKETLRLLNLYPWQIKDDNHSDALAGAINWLLVGDIERGKPKSKKSSSK